MPVVTMATRSRSDKGPKRKKGRFEKRCGCIQHEHFTEHTATYNLLSCTKNKHRKPLQLLIEKELLPKRSAWVCSVCLNHSKIHFCMSFAKSSAHREKGENISGNNSTDIDKADSTDNESDDDHVDDKNPRINLDNSSGTNDVLDKIMRSMKELPKKWSSFNSDQQKQIAGIAYTLGTIIEGDLFEDCEVVTKESNNLADFDTDKIDWLASRNEVLVSFLKGCTKTKVDKKQELTKTNALIHSVEQVLKTRKLHVISPFAFQRNVVQYTVTGSKLATNLMGSWEAAGGYTKVQKFINGPADVPKIPEGDVHTAIDNEQRVGRSSGRIREGSSIRVDICTTMSCLQTERKGDMQEKMELKPESWRKRDTSDLKDIISDVEAEEEKSMNVFREYRERFIEDIIQEVETELDRATIDHIDVAVEHKKRGHSNYVCCKCAYVSADRGTCPKCNHDPNQHSIDHDVYHRTPSNHPNHPPSMRVVEPCMVNPCSKESLHRVLEHVQEQCEVGDDKDRKWVYTWCDAVPYLIGSKVQEETLKCALCGEMINKTDMSSHQDDMHKEEEAEFEEWFGGIFLRPGPGHIELNMARALLKLLWDPYMQHYAILLGFRSPRAQDVIHRGLDHHGSRQILLTLLNAIAKELVRPFVVHQREVKKETNSDQFFEWYDQVKDNNYRFSWCVCFTYLLSFQLYTEAVRKNHHQHMMAARAAFAPLFFGRNHPRYRELHLRDMMDRVQAPEDLKEDMAANESFSLSGAYNKGQGVDFLHEEVNRTLKTLLPPGAVTADLWTRVCRKADSLTEMKNKCIKTSGFQSTSGKRAPKRHDHEETMMRREIRQAKLLEKPMYENNNLKSIDGNALDHDLPNMVQTMKSSYKEYKEELVKTGKFGGGKLTQTLYITPEERARGESMESKTKQVIKEVIQKLISEYGLNNFSVNQLKQSSKKDDYLKLYYEVQEALEDEQCQMIEEEEMVEDNVEEGLEE